MSLKLPSPSTPQNVAVLIFPFTSHPGALLRFVRSIAAVAPEMNFTFFSVTRSNNSLFSSSNSTGFENIKPHNVWDGLPDGYVPQPGNPMKQIEMFLDTAPRTFRRAIKEVEAKTGHKFGCLIADAFLWFTHDIAQEMQVPWVAYWVAGQRTLLAHVETDTIRERVGVLGQEDKTVDFLPGFSDDFLASDLPDEVMGNLDMPFPRMMHKMGKKLPQADAVAINGFEMMDVKVTEELKKRVHNLFLVGPLNLTPAVPLDGELDDENGCLQWLDKHKPASVAYISFGSMANLPPVEVAAIAEAFEEGGFPFLWSFRGSQDNFPPGFVERTSSIGKIVPWVNQVQILNHVSVGVHVTHCGWNSVLESVTCGVPMIGRADFADQRINMRCSEVIWRIGMRIEGGAFTKTGLLKALEQTLLLEQGKELRQRVGKLKKLAQEAVGVPNGRSAQDLKALVDIIKSG